MFTKITKHQSLIKILLVFIVVINIFFSALFVFDLRAAPSNPTQDLPNKINNELNKAGGQSGYGTYSTVNDSPYVIVDLISQVINIVLGSIGVIFLIFIISSGIQWMTAGGNEEAVTKAKKRLVNAAIGLAIVFMAFIITYLITNYLIVSTDYNQP